MQKFNCFFKAVTTHTHVYIFIKALNVKNRLFIIDIKKA